LKKFNRKRGTNEDDNYTLNLIIDSNKNEERLQQCDPGQEIFQNQKKASLIFNLHSTKQQ
jgi:hypothetical protein